MNEVCLVRIVVLRQLLAECRDAAFDANGLGHVPTDWDRASVRENG